MEEEAVKELKALLSSELDLLYKKAHHSGLNYWEIFKVNLDKTTTLAMMSEAEYALKGGK